MKKPSRKTLRNKCDKMWSLIIRSKNNGKCEVCGINADNPHHIISRKNLSLRWDIRNGCLLCSGCHTLRRKSAHADPMWFISEWLTQNRTEDYNYLWEKKEEIMANIDYEEVIKNLEKKL